MTTSISTPAPSHSPVNAGSTLGRGRWPLLGVAAGVGAIVGTLVLDIHPTSWNADDTYTVDVVDEISSGKAHASVVVGYITVALLLVLAAAWRRHVEPRALASTAARVVPLGLTAAAGALSLGYGWRGALGLYLGNEEGAFDKQGLYVLYVLNDFGAYIGYLGVTVAAGAVVWMSLRERLVSRWIGIFSILPILPVVVTVAAFGLPGFPGVSSGLWLIVAFAGLAFGKSTINR
ncbi:hypothetical protein [Nocardioides sp. R-C-SC26]|uniref:hypothetical protein n=1 Tax=Nocardioides sp. R-C-SC26 TaxID=2870414 RepID=UPI001E5AA562|nr:hypothetical protein [Nocardioides sp. R-C-SC26]